MLVTVGPWQFDVEATGPPDARPVLLLHGFPQTNRSWEAVSRRLVTAGLRTIAPNQRGYSPGARPGDVAEYAMRALVGDTVGLLDSLGIDAVDVVGHDWGANVAWFLASWHPERVRTLTAVSVPHPLAYAWAFQNDIDQQTRSGYIELFRIPGKAEEVLLADGARRLRSMLADVPLVDEYVTAVSEPGALTAALNWYRAMTGRDLRDLGPITVPTTFVWSTADIAVAAAGALRCGEHVAGDYRFVQLDGVSHWIPDHAPDALADAVLARIAEARP